MTILWLIHRNILQRALSSGLTLMSVALGVMLVVAILVVRDELERTYLRQGEGYSLVVGPSGSRLELVLNSIFHVDQSSGLIPYSIQEELSGPKWERYVRLSVPYALGDSFRGYRVVATTDGIFSPDFPHPDGAGEQKLVAGRPFSFDQHNLDDAFAHLSGGDAHAHDHAAHAPFEAVLGFEVARRLGLRLGDEIEPSHGVEGAKDHRDEHVWTVVGVLRRTGTPVDRVVFINLDSFYSIAEHAGGIIPGTNEPAISSVLLFPRPGYAKAVLLANLSKRADIQVAEVGREINKLLTIVGGVDRVFMVVAVLVVVIGVISVMVAIYNTMNERRREIAIMRAIGASRTTVMATIVGESAALSLGGAVVGFVLAHALLYGFAGRVERISGMLVDPSRILPEEVAVVAVVAIAGAVAGLIPAWKAYRCDVARHLAPTS